MRVDTYKWIACYIQVPTHISLQPVLKYYKFEKLISVYKVTAIIIIIMGCIKNSPSTHRRTRESSFIGYYTRTSI